MNKAKIIAEIGAVHLGSLERAKELASLSRICGADYVKTQKRNPEESTPNHMRDLPHPNKIFSYGDTYLEHRQNLELDIQEHIELKKYCDSIGIKYSSSVWDITSAREIINLNPDFIKVPSACNQHWKMLNIIKDEYDGQIHISSGMTTREETEKLVEWMKPIGERIVYYHCTSKYPCPFENLYLLEIEKMKPLTKYGITLGFSNHGKGIASDMAAYVLGAEWIERHFIDDRTIRHTDAAASLEPSGLKKLCRDLNAVYRAMDIKPKKMDEEEIEQRKKLKFSGDDYGNGS